MFTKKLLRSPHLGDRKECSESYLLHKSKQSRNIWVCVLLRNKNYPLTLTLLMFFYDKTPHRGIHPSGRKRCSGKIVNGKFSQ